MIKTQIEKAPRWLTFYASDPWKNKSGQPLTGVSNSRVAAGFHQYNKKYIFIKWCIYLESTYFASSYESLKKHEVLVHEKNITKRTLSVLEHHMIKLSSECSKWRQKAKNHTIVTKDEETKKIELRTFDTVMQPTKTFKDKRFRWANLSICCIEHSLKT